MGLGLAHADNLTSNRDRLILLHLFQQHVRPKSDLNNSQ